MTHAAPHMAEIREPDELCWRGIPVSSMSREELIEVVGEATRYVEEMERNQSHVFDAWRESRERARR